jgi:hypothetical protein
MMGGNDSSRKKFVIPSESSHALANGLLKPKDPWQLVVPPCHMAHAIFVSKFQDENLVSVTGYKAA